MGLRITTWNVNGIRNPFGYQPWRDKRTFQAMFDILEADIVVFQETKIQRKDLTDDMVLVPGWDVHFSLPRHKKGYSGVAIYTRNSACCPIRAEEGITGVLCPPSSTTKFRDLPTDQQIGGYPKSGQLLGIVDDVTLDSEGRCVILEFPAFVLIGTYSPANRDESRDDFRNGYLEALDVRVRNLVAAGKEVILTGDLNVIGTEIDTSNLPETLRKHNMTLNEWLDLPARRLFNHLIFHGQVMGARDEDKEPVMWDLCRVFHPDRQGMFTCWDTKKNTRPANNGSRIDYILCSAGIKNWFTSANIQEGLMGSDHCPVFATIGDVVKLRGAEVHIGDLINPEGMFREGKRLREWAPKDLLPMSARLIPEFDRRRSIRDMFMKKPNPSPTAFDNKEATEKRLKALEYAPGSLIGKEKSMLGLSAEDSPVAPSLDASAQPQRKRGAETPSSPIHLQKKNKAVEGTSSSKTNSSLSQSRLTGFFKPKQQAKNAANGKALAGPFIGLSQNPSLGEANQTASPERESGLPDNKVKTAPADKTTKIQSSGAAMEETSEVFDPIQAKESWSKLLSKRVVPNCEHGEPCKSLLTKKAGVNCGRSFYICNRPLGPSGEKEKGTEWRCGTFIWSSDWNGSPSRPQ